MFKELRIGSINLKNNIIQAPMAGITDYVLRKLIREFSADTLLTTEMISSEALCNKPCTDILKRDDEQSPISYQLSGHKPFLMAKASQIIADMADIIDINMGCPVNKVIKSTDGCALMGNPDLAADIVKAVIDSTGKTVTCKFRLGIKQESKNFVPFAVKMQEAGASAVCIHARTRVQMYSGTANWAEVSALKGELDIPYFINGDITSPEKAKEAMMLSGADGVAIGRGLLSNLYLPSQVEEYFKTGNYTPDLSLLEKINLLKRLIDMEIELRGYEVGIKFVRKYYSYYIKGVREGGSYRYKLVTETDYDKIMATLDEIVQNNEMPISI